VDSWRLCDYKSHVVTNKSKANHLSDAAEMGVAVETVIEENFAETVLADKTLLSSLKFVSFDDPRTSNLSSLSEPK